MVDHLKLGVTRHLGEREVSGLKRKRENTQVENPEGCCEVKMQAAYWNVQLQSTVAGGHVG